GETFAAPQRRADGVGQSAGFVRLPGARADDRETPEGRVAELGAELELLPVELVEVLPRDGLERVVAGVLRLDDHRAVGGDALGPPAEGRQPPSVTPRARVRQRMRRAADAADQPGRGARVREGDRALRAADDGAALVARER